MTQTTTAADSSLTGTALYIGLDLSRDSWQVALGDGKKLRQVAVDRRDLDSGKSALLAEISKAKQHFALAPEAQVVVVFEAGRDGFWFARWLEQQDIRCLIVDPASLPVDRRSKHRKTDAIDARGLLDLLIRHELGQISLHLVAIPTPEEEDRRELGRGLERLNGARSRLALSLQSLLFKHGISAAYTTGFQEQLADLRTGDGRPLGSTLREHCAVLCRQIHSLDIDICKLEDQRQRQVEKPESPTEQIAHNLQQLYGIGPIGAVTLADELFGWRKFANAKKLGSFLGLCPTPFATGTIDREQGISKAGPGRLRALLIQLAWGWLRYQPESALTQWFVARNSAGAKRKKRVDIIAVARKLAVALWRYVTTGAVPAGAAFKPELHRISPVAPRGCAVRQLARRKAPAATAVPTAAAA